MKKIKVVFVQYKLVFGGVEKALFDLVNLMDKDKFEVVVFVQYPGHEWDQKFLDAGIRVEYDYTCRKPTWNLVKKLDNLRKKLLINQSLKNNSAGLLDICCPDADIVVDYSVWDNYEIPFTKKAKCIKYIHGDPGTNPVYRREAQEDTERLVRYDRIVCVSQAAFAAFCQISGLSKGVQMHYNPIDSQQVCRLAQETVNIPVDLPIVCAVGRLSVEKSFERLLLIHRNLIQRGMRYRLVIVGDGPDRDFLERLIRATGIQDSVIMTGYQANPYPYMKMSRFLVNSSLSEGLPVIAMEALSLGIPIVAPIPSVKEAFGDEMCGLITENSMEALEEGMYKMLTDDDLYARAKAGAHRRSANFDGNYMTRQIEEMFLDLAAEE